MMGKSETGLGPSTPDGTANAAPETSRIDPRLLEILVCPLTKTTLEYDAGAQELISRVAKLAYPIRDGIPIMLPEEARPLTD
ncbi:MAG: Trm112 family protein [Beijerinckiaceae bacterium]|nr:Trm112 family protein [Beijerinckiaceae bacterium]